MTMPTTTNTSRPRAKGYDLRIGTQYFRLAPMGDQPWIRQTADVIPARIGTEQLAEEMGERITRTVARNDFRGGSGLEFAHRRNAASDDVVRYWDSQGIDFTEGDLVQRTVRLLGEPESLPPTASGEITAPEIYGQRVYVADGSALRRTNLRPWGTTVSWSSLTVTGATGNIYGLCAHTDGNLYASEFGGDLHQYDGSSWTSVFSSSSTSYRRIWSVKKRLLATNGPTLYEHDIGGATRSTLVSLPTFSDWVAAVDAGSYIAAVARLSAPTGGKGSQIYLYGTESGDLLQEGFVELEEYVWEMVGQGGYLFWVSSETYQGVSPLRLWRGEVTAAGGLANATLLGEMDRAGVPNSQHRGNMVVTEEAVYVIAVDNTSSAEKVEAYRLDLATMGLHRHLVIDSGAPTLPYGQGLAVGDELWIQVTAAGTGTKGMYRPSNSNYESSGWLILPLLDLYTARPKEWLGLTAWLSSIADDESLKLYYSTDPEALSDSAHSSWTLLSTIASGSGGSEASFSSVNSRWLAVKIELLASTDQATSPELYAIAARAYAGSGATQYQFPINVSDQVERPNRKRLRVRGRGETAYAALVALEGTQQEVEVLRPNQTITGVIVRVSAPIVVKTDRGSSLQVASVVVEGE